MRRYFSSRFARRICLARADGPLSYVLYTAHSAWPSCLPCLAIALAVLVLAALASLLLVLIPGFLYVSFPFIK